MALVICSNIKGRSTNKFPPNAVIMVPLKPTPGSLLALPSLIISGRVLGGGVCSGNPQQMIKEMWTSEVWLWNSAEEMLWCTTGASSQTSTLFIFTSAASTRQPVWQSLNRTYNNKQSFTMDPVEVTQGWTVSKPCVCIVELLHVRLPEYVICTGFCKGSYLWLITNCTSFFSESFSFVTVTGLSERLFFIIFIYSFICHLTDNSCHICQSVHLSETFCFADLEASQWKSTSC